MSGMETMEDLTLCHLSQMNQEIQEFVAKEVHVLKERAKGTSERAKGHVRKLSRIIMNTAWDVCHFKSQPQWMQDNDFLHFGHRPQLPSFKACLMSIFRLHTETGNIWTHLIGCIFFLGLSLYLYLFSPYTLNFEDKIVFGIYFLAVTVCLFFSTVFHTFSCHSHEVGKICCKLDYCGITLLSTGSFIPWIHYAFNCRPEPRVFYLTLMTIMGISVAIFSMREKFGTADYRVFRTVVFVAFGLSIALPFFHWFLTINHVKISLLNVGLVALFYIGGAALYAMRIPERFFPGKCDIWFQSHQIFHVFVIIAAVIHYLNIHDIASLKSPYHNPNMMDVDDVCRLE